MRWLMPALVAAMAATSSAQAQPPQAVLPPGVAVRADGPRLWLTTPEGLTLYHFAQGSLKAKDGPCLDDCTKDYPPLLAPADAKPVGDWTVVQHPEVGRQWAYRGRPLHTFHLDSKPGDTEAFQTMRGSWLVAEYSAILRQVATPASVEVRASFSQLALSDLSGKLLYTRDGEVVGGDFLCTGACLDEWTPLVAPLTARPVGEWTVAHRPDGLRQWAFRGKPVYTYDRDVKSGDRLGELAMSWRLATIEPSDGAR